MYNEDELYAGGRFDHWGSQRVAVVVINPNKLRMSPLLAPGKGQEIVDKHTSLVDEWKTWAGGLGGGPRCDLLVFVSSANRAGRDCICA